LNILIVTDAYIPSRLSAAILLYELVQTFSEAAVDVTIIVPNSDQVQLVSISNSVGCRLISVKALQTKDISYIRRTLHEFFNPFIIWMRLQKEPSFIQSKFDGIVWYSPSIFWGPLIKRLKNEFRCSAYLILRDLFPDWALHLGILKNHFIYWCLKKVEQYQYTQADSIGIQSPNNLTYFRNQNSQVKASLEVLWNWVRPLAKVEKRKCSLIVSETKLSGRKIFVYAGNLGMAQGVDALLKMAKDLVGHHDIGILVVGRGSELEYVREQVFVQDLINMEVREEIDPFEIPNLFAQCHAGLILLDQRHKTHNIPGKLVTYLQSGLPILALVNPGNDLIDLIPQYQIGIVYAGNDINKLSAGAVALKKQIEFDQKLTARCIDLAEHLFNSEVIANQILETFKKD